MIVSDLVRLEFSAFVSRAVRTKRFDSDQAALALKSFDELYKSCDSLEHTLRDFSRADELIREFATKLGAADALHLASVLAPADIGYTLTGRSQIESDCSDRRSLKLSTGVIHLVHTYTACTKLSSTIFRPALSKSTVSLLPSTSATVPGPNFR